MPPSPYIAFADESGHSGGNFLDLQQPFFVMAAWVVPVEQVPSMAELIERARASHTPSRGTSRELKFGQLVKGEKGQKIVDEVVTGMILLGAVPVVEAWEKKFAIATRMVHEFCEWDCNPVAGRRLPPHDGDARRSFAYWLDENLPETAATEFASAFQAMDRGLLEGARNRISTLLRLSGRDDDGAMIRACNIDELVDGSEKDHRNIHFPAFLGLLGRIERCLTVAGGTAPLIYDEQNEFARPFGDAFALMRQGGSIELPLGLTRTARFGASRIDSLTMDQSRASPGIQAADALAAAVRAGLADPSQFAQGGAMSRGLRLSLGVPDGGGVPAHLERTVALVVGLRRLQSILHAVAPRM